MNFESYDYVEVLHSKGFRVTIQRKLILDTLCQKKDHVTLGELYASVKLVQPSVDLSTIYRTLHLFVMLGLVMSIDNVGKGEKVYEIVKSEPHHHIVCRQCGLLETIKNQAIQPLFNSLKRQQHFSSKIDHVVIFGICFRCLDSSYIHDA